MKFADYKYLIFGRLTMEDVMEEAGIAVSNHEAICPFHAEDTASFHAYSDNGHCFGCGWNGDLIKFEMEFYNLPFNEAVERLDNVFSLGLPLKRKMTVQEQMRIEKQRTLFRKRQIARKAAEEQREKHLADYCEAIRDANKYAPISLDLPWVDKWCEAMKRKDYLAYLIDCDTAEIYRSEKR